MGEHTLFFYGTLMAPPVLHRVIYGNPHPTPLTHPAMQFLRIRPALLRDYRRHRVAKSDYPAVVPDKNGDATVRGSVVEGLTDGDVYRLDIFEGSQYDRLEVGVEVLEGVGLDEAAVEEKGDGEVRKGEVVKAQTYVWKEAMEGLEPQEWDFEEFKKSKMRAWMGLGAEEGVEVDEGFADVDRAVAADEEKSEKKDPTGGRGWDGEIGKQLKEVQRNGHENVVW